MQKHKVLILLGIVLAIFLSGYGLLKWDEYRKTEFIEDKVVKLVNTTKEDLLKISFEDKDVFTVSNKNNQWIEAGYENILYKQDQLEELVDQVLALESTQLISNIQDKNSYGIEPGAMRITIYNKANEMETLRIGSSNLSKGIRYIWSEKSELIYIVPEESLGNILVGKGDLIDTTLVLPKKDEINQLIIMKEKETLSLQKNAVTEVGKEWLLDSLYKTPHLVSSAQIDPYLSLIETFSKDKLVRHSKEDLEKYGLEQPSLTLKINDKIEMVFGKEENNGIYFMWNQDAYIYQMQTDKVNSFKNIKAFDLIEKIIYQPKIETVSKIELSNPNYNIVLEVMDEIIKTEGQPDKVVKVSKVDQTTFDEIQTQEMFALITDIKMHAPLLNPGLEQKGQRPAEIKITYTLKDNTVVALEFIPFDPSFYVLRIGENIEFVVDKGQVMNIFNIMTAILKKDAKS